MYYYIGCHLASYSGQMKAKDKVVLLFLVALLQAINIYFECNGGIFDWGTFGGYSCSYNALPTVILTYLLFSLLDDVKINSGYIKKLLKKISAVSLEIFLVALMFGDNLVHVLFFGKITSLKGYCIWIVPYTIIDVLFSFTVALGVAWIVKKAIGLMYRLKNERITLVK